MKPVRIQSTTFLKRLLALFGKYGWEKKIHGDQVRLPVAGHALKNLLFFNRRYDTYERDYFPAVLGRISPDDVVFDIGAYKGFFTVAFARRVARGRVIAFEPNPATYLTLLETVRLNQLDNVIALPIAVGAGKGITSFAMDGSSSHIDSLRSLPTPHDAPSNVTVLDVSLERVTTITGVFPTFIKLDVEGFEYVVLGSSNDTFRKCRVICLEIHPDKLKQWGNSDTDVVSRLEDLGFSQVFHQAHASKVEGKPYNVIYEREQDES